MSKEKVAPLYVDSLAIGSQRNHQYYLELLTKSYHLVFSQNIIDGGDWLLKKPSILEEWLKSKKATVLCESTYADMFANDDFRFAIVDACIPKNGNFNDIAECSEKEQIMEIASIVEKYGTPILKCMKLLLKRLSRSPKSFKPKSHPQMRMAFLASFIK